MGAPKVEYTVTVIKTEKVAANLPLQDHWLPLSNLDLLLPPLDFGVFFCYKNTGVEHDELGFRKKVSNLKVAMAKALVSFYPLAGEVAYNPLGEPELLCNNRGVEFVEASADVVLSELNLYKPDESIEGKLVPKKKYGVLAVQVTELKCGGMVVSCTFDHRISDAYSANLFLVAWSELAAGKPTSMTPCFRRSLVNPRRPGYYDPSIDDMYVLIKTLGNLQQDVESPAAADRIVSRIYYIPSHQLDHIQRVANANDENNNINGHGHGQDHKRSVTKLQSFTAFLWKLVAEHACSRRNDRKLCQIGMVVNGRRRLQISDDDHPADQGNDLMSRYFGNVLSVPFGGKTCNELKNHSVSWAASVVHDFLEPAVTKHHFLGLIDWVEAHRPDAAMTRIYNRTADDGPALVVSSGQGFPVSQVDFGWGKPLLGSYHFPWGGNCGYVMPMPCPRTTANAAGDWIVYMNLTATQFDFLETEAPLVFNRLTLDLFESSCTI